MSVTPAQSRRQVEHQLLLNSPFTICGATCPPQMGGQLRKEKGKVDSLSRHKQLPIHPQFQPSNSQNLKRKNLPQQQLEKTENGLFIEI